MKPTKQHILDHALKQFNQHGFVNVRLQHIADAAFVSVGHLAYHFKNKDTIVDTLYEELKFQQQLLLREFSVVPLFEDIHRQLISIFILQKKYLFFYLDTLEIVRAYPAIKAKHAEHISWKLQQIECMIRFNMSRGAFRHFSDATQIGQTALHFNSCIDNWIYSRMLTGLDCLDEKDFTQSIWSFLHPFFTDMGEREFMQLHDPI